MTSTSNSSSSPSGLMQVLEEFLAKQARGENTEIESYLISLPAIGLVTTRATVHCHFVPLDGNQRPTAESLARFLVERIIDYSIPRREILKAEEHLKKTRSSHMFKELGTKAKNLFTDIANTGEGGELLLYVLVERYLRIPQLICKMPLKTNPNVHYHGVDGIHAAIDHDRGTLALYWGESKLYHTMSEALRECLSSIEPYLNSFGGARAPLERDIQLIRDSIDLENDNAQQAILAILDKDNPLHHKIEYRGACLVGFDFEGYPSKPMELTLQQVRGSIEKELSDWYGKVTKKLKDKTPLDRFNFEVFLVPLPSVEQFRAAFLQELKFS